MVMRRRIQRAISLLRNEYPTRGPDFFVVGATRSGTTYLHHLLAKHSHIFMPTKELNYFNHSGKYRTDLGGYYRMFDGYVGQAVIGEVSPNYLDVGALYDASGKFTYLNQDSAMNRIARHLPSTLIIVTLRNPFTRMLSMYEKGVGQRKVKTSFQDLLEAELTGHQTRLNLIYRNRYDIHIGYILSRFPRDQVKILLFEEWTADVPSVHRDLQSFLNVPIEATPALSATARNLRERYTKQKRDFTGIESLPSSVIDGVIVALKPTKQYLEEFLGRNLPWSYHF